MDLIIVESPTKARTLSRFLGKDYEVLATMGHIKDLPKSKLSVDVEKDFAPDYQVVDARKKEIAAIKKAAKKAKKLYLATDPDREGEAISSHVKEVLSDGKNKVGADKMTRIVFHEITKEAVEEAISHASTLNTHLVDAQIARRVLDRLVGYRLSPLLWKKVRRGLSAGRVQTVAVRLIVEKEREIEKFKREEYWEIFANVYKKGGAKSQAFDIKLAKHKGKTLKVSDKKSADKVVADLKKAKYVVSEIKKREVKKSPYPPFTTSTMTQASANNLGWSSKKTMSVAQKLYEEGLITYHRTDSFNIAQQALAKTRKFIEDKYGKDFVPESPRVYKTKSKSAQEAHEAIRPTDVTIKDNLDISGKFKSDAERLYDLIWRRFVACQMANSVADSTTVEVAADEYLLRTSGQVMKFTGWREVYTLKNKDDVILPAVEEKDELDLNKLDPQQKFTQPPARYNEASLIKMLESLGIGRPSTYAPTISTIQTRQYVEKEDRRFKPTLVGISVTDFMIKNFPDVFDYDFTAEMEGDLDQVAQGKKEWQKMMKAFYNPFEKKVEDVDKNAKRVAIPTESLGRKCPTCKKEGRDGKEQGELVVRTGRFGKFISCSKFPECKHTEKFVIKIKMKCPDCTKGDVIVKKTRKGRTFYGCSRYPDCEYASWTDPSAKDKKKEEANDESGE